MVNGPKVDSYVDPPKFKGVHPGKKLLHFPEIKEIVDKGILDVLGRTPKGQAEYRAFREKLYKEWFGMQDYILFKKFDIKPSRDQKTSKLRILPSSVPEKAMSTLCLNDFPYNFAADVKHFVLWKLNEALTQADIEKAIQELHSNNKVKNVVSFINPVRLRSIREIDHAHIIIQVQN
eukprot:CAMPEP_0167751048 /NCGR_PEP_ID=MMETSP0110_2-20121227/6342_1 /TAXON_ID=629695 /ORGANISM="Gymnochlora sp., Strain CCMP2014" /LENGTH=176 /DNA_ID=CAMNT_0007636461 /DNA_START=100 /DNA_END=630 /DNA_ORIENTATION=+